ncbi:putative ribonuclease H-like domain-containing protein [Tanacetum coccineum]
MSGNIAHLSDFKEFDGGYVTFGGGANGGRITGKGTIKTDKLDFEDVYFVKELKFNLFSVSQMCDKKNYVLFTDSECLVLSPNFKLPDESQILLKIPRQNNMYSFDMKNIVPKDGLTCLVAKATSEESMLWHRRLGHVNFKNINKLVKENLVRDLPLKRFENDQTCVACLKGKQHRVSCKTKAFSPITKPLFMLHMDLFGPTFVSSLMHKKYCLVVTDDYSRFSWVFFLRTKDETSEILKNFIKEIENLVDKKVKIIRSDNGTEFKNHVMDEFCREKGIKREYSVARTPQQNGVAERKNRTLIEAARTMLADSKLPTTFWAEAVSTACYVQNRVLIVKPHNKTPYELFRGIKPAIGFMKPFGCHVTILNTLDKLGKFDGKSDEGFFVGYSLSSKAFRVYNIRTRKVQENLHVGFLENKPMLEGNGPKWLFDLDSLTQSMNYVPVVAGTFSNVSAGIQGVSESSTSSQQDQDCIVMPIWKDASYFDDASLKSVADVQIQDQDGTHDDCSLQDNGTADQQVNTASPEVNTGSREVSTAVPEVNTATPEDLMGPIPTSEDTQVEDQEIELGNISPSYAVSSTPHTRIHKDHPIDHVIGDVQSSVQTRRMTTSYSELGFIGAIYEGKTYQDIHTCLFACFLSQEEPKRVSKALSDPGWVKAMQEELLQFKLQNVWVLVDLPKVTKKPEVCVSFIKQFWRSAEASTDDNGEGKINATIDGHSLSITEGSLRRHLKLADQDGVTSIPTTEIFEQLALMGYHTDSDKLTFQKGVFSPQWRFLIHNILHCLSPKKTAWEQFSSNIAAAVICLATNRKFNFSRMIFEHMVSNISSPHKFLMYPRFIQICLDMQKHQFQQHTRTYPVPSLTMKVFSNMKRPTKGFSGQEVALFPTMLAVPAPSTSPSRITSSPSPTPSQSPEPTLAHTPSPTQPSPTQPSPTQPSPTQPGPEHQVPTPHDSPLHAVHSHGSDEGEEVILMKRFKKKQVLTLNYSSKVTPTEVIQDQEGSEKTSDEVSTAGAKKDTTAEEVPIVSTAEVDISTKASKLNEEQRSSENCKEEEIARQWMKKKGKRAMEEAKTTKKIDCMILQSSDIISLRNEATAIARSKKKYDQIFLRIKGTSRSVTSRESKRKKSIPRKSTRKRQKLEEDAEKDDLKGFLDIVPREEAPIEVESISTRFPIMDWKTYILTETFMYYQVFRAIHMLTEKKYPLSQEMLTKMLSKKLEVDHESSQAFELLRFTLGDDVCDEEENNQRIDYGIVILPLREKRVGQ